MDIPRITQPRTYVLYMMMKTMQVREMIIAGHQDPNPLSNAEAVKKLKSSWQTGQDRRVAQWNEQVLQDQTEREEEERIEQELEAQRRQE
jgi:hypothetical protein